MRKALERGESLSDYEDQIDWNEETKDKTKHDKHELPHLSSKRSKHEETVSEDECSSPSSSEDESDVLLSREQKLARFLYKE